LPKTSVLWFLSPSTKIIQNADQSATQQNDEKNPKVRGNHMVNRNVNSEDNILR